MAKKFRLAGAIRRMMNRQLSMGWERWQEWYEDFKQQQFLLLGGINRFRNSLLSMP